MIRAAATTVKEVVRCTRHNLLHLNHFHLSYAGGGRWVVGDGRVRMIFPRYPYLAFHEMEGYLFDGKWRPEPGMTVLDVGGCYGEYALYASQRVGPTGKVIMLEPDPQNIAVARETFRLNGDPGNIQIIPAGLWNKPGKLRFNAGLAHQSAVATDDDAAHGGHTIEIDTYTLAGLVEALDLDRLDLVKMDIEGAEIEVISAAGELPPNLRPRFAIASYHVVNGRRTADTLEAMFPELDYHCRTGYPAHLTTWASPTPLD
jgi:FkbM family methyltransferase